MVVIFLWVVFLLGCGDGFVVFRFVVRYGFFVFDLLCILVLKFIKVKLRLNLEE